MIFLSMKGAKKRYEEVCSGSPENFGKNRY